MAKSKSKVKSEGEGKTKRTYRGGKGREGPRTFECTTLTPGRRLKKNLRQTEADWRAKLSNPNYAKKDSKAPKIYKKIREEYNS